MNDINNVFIIGRLTRDAELKYTNSGTAVCKFSIANSAYQGQGKENYTNYFDCILWGNQGESVNQYLTKGKQIAIAGELRQNRWETEGQKRSKIEINVRTVQLIGGRKENQDKQPDNFEDDLFL